MPSVEPFCLSVIIPVFNESMFLHDLLRRVLAVPVSKEIILVDDCSSDGSREKLRLLESDPRPLLEGAAAPAQFKFLYHGTNQGKGAAIRTGIAAATTSITIIQDADLEYDPNDYLKLIAPLLSGEAEVVYGSRFADKQRYRQHFWHTLGNRALTILSNGLTGLRLTDMETCYKAFRTDIIKSLPIRSNRFGFEPEITAKVAKLKCRIVEVPISYCGRSATEGKKITWWDGLKAIFTIIWFWAVDDLGPSRTEIVTHV